MPETKDTEKNGGATKTEIEKIYEKKEKEDKHSDEDGKDDKDEKEGKDKKKNKKDKDEKNDEKDNKKNKKKDKKEKNPNDKDLEKLKLKVEKIDAKMQDLEDKREVILELFNEAGKIAANASAVRLPFDPLSTHLTKKKKKAK